MAMPVQKPGRSEQSVGTPRVFLDAVEKRFGKIGLDVAALPENAVASRFWTPTDNGLEQSWRSLDGIAFCNPPYGNITPWVTKASFEWWVCGSPSLVLVPASVGSNWWRQRVHREASIYLLNGRLTFVGHDKPFPKDCALLLYGPRAADRYTVWDWKHGVME